jgi:hypothetical protein
MGMRFGDADSVPKLVHRIDGRAARLSAILAPFLYRNTHF